jgi:hypothetical protein
VRRVPGPKLTVTACTPAVSITPTTTNNSLITSTPFQPLILGGRRLP